MARRGASIDIDEVRTGRGGAQPAGEALAAYALDLAVLGYLCQLARTRGIEVYFDERPELVLQGSIFAGSQGGYVMWVNAKDTLPEQCDTVAHELGHWCLHRPSAPRAAYWQKQGRQAGLRPVHAREVQADRFAKRLLGLVRLGLRSRATGDAAAPEGQPQPASNRPASRRTSSRNLSSSAPPSSSRASTKRRSRALARSRR
jgi:hypothetical protein